MFKLFAVLLVGTFLAAPASAQVSAGDPGDVGRTSAPTNTATEILDTPGINGGHQDLTGTPWSDTTNTQGAGAPNGPKLFGTNSYEARPGVVGDSGAATGAPFPGSYIAPANIALYNQFHGTKKELPPTRIGSFVHDSEYANDIYGNESSHGPPRLNNFSPIDTGINSDDLSTGHKSDAPSASGTPQ